MSWKTYDFSPFSAEYVADFDVGVGKILSVFVIFFGVIYMQITCEVEAFFGVYQHIPLDYGDKLLVGYRVPELADMPPVATLHVEK